MLARLERVFSAAIRALGLAGMPHVQIDLRVCVPELHVSLGVRTEHATLRSQVLGQQFHVVLAHGIW